MAESVPAASGPVDAPAVPAAIDEQPGHKVFAGNLAYATTDEDLKSFFAPVADDIVSAQVIMRGQRPAGYGFVAFKSAEAAQKAVELLNKKELDGRTLIVEVAKPTDQKEKEKKEKRASKKRPKKVKSTDSTPATNGATEVKENGEKPAATEGAPKPKKKRNLRTKVKKAKDTVAGAITGKEGDASAAPADGAVTAPAAVESTKPKKAKTPRAPKPKRPIGEAPVGEPSKTMLFVANLGFAVDDATLSELFTSAGINVHSARVVRRRWGHPRRSKGYGFVDVGSEDEQIKALELLQGKEVGGREIAVKIAVNSQEKEAREALQAEETPSLAPAAAA